MYKEKEGKKKGFLDDSKICWLIAKAPFQDESWSTVGNT